MKVAVVGATGMVGNVMLQVLREQNFPITELIPVASEKSVGTEIDFGGLKFKVVGLETAVNMRPDVAIFSAGGETSLEWAPKFAEVGTTVIDNSSAWRMDPTKKLIVPEINGNELTATDKITIFSTQNGNRLTYNNNWSIVLQKIEKETKQVKLNTKN